MNHIDEGLGILYEIGASDQAMRAYCLHPLFQMDEDLRSNFKLHGDLPRDSILLAMEYRNIANAYLSHKKIDKLEDIRLSPLKDVNDMPIADKVQNYKDFLNHHYPIYHRSEELDEYFHNWFKRLGVNFWELEKILKPF